MTKQTVSAGITRINIERFDTLLVHPAPNEKPNSKVYFRHELIKDSEDTPFAEQVDSAVNRVLELLGSPSNGDESRCYLAYIAGDREAVADMALMHSREPFYSALNYLMSTTGAVASTANGGKFRVKIVLREALIKAVEHHSNKIFDEVSFEVANIVA